MTVCLERHWDALVNDVQERDETWHAQPAMIRMCNFFLCLFRAAFRAAPVFNCLILRVRAYRHRAYRPISAALKNSSAPARHPNTRLRERGIVRDNGNTLTSTRDGETSSTACRPLYRPSGPSRHDGGAPRTSLATHSKENPIQSVDADAWCSA